MKSPKKPKNKGKSSSDAPDKKIKKLKSEEKTTNQPQPFNMAARKKKARQAFDNAKYRCKTDPTYKAVKFLFVNYKEFLSDIGLPKSQKLSLDRIDTKGHYEPGNVRWTSSAVQAVNKKNSTLGTGIPFYHLEQIFKHQAYQSELRSKVAIVWSICVNALNRSGLTEEEAIYLRTNPVAKGVLEADFDYNTPYDGWFKPVGVFHLPSLTVPGERVRLRGGPISAGGPSWERSGTIGCLGRHKLEINLSPSQLLSAKSNLEAKAGVAWAGSPSFELGSTGGVEGAMIAIASRMRTLGVATAIFPAVTISDELNQLGKYWKDQTHPILDAQYLFIPDFQIDQGAGYDLSSAQQFSLSNLLEYRLAQGLKTWVGVQNVAKLNQPAKKIILGHYKVEDYSKFTEIAHPPKGETPITQEKSRMREGRYSLAYLQQFPAFSFLLKEAS